MDIRPNGIRAIYDLTNWNPADYPEDEQSQKAPGGTLNKQALETWGMEVK